MSTNEKLLQKVKSVRLSNIVADQIIDLIEDGSLEVGDQLPGERELVDQLGVGRASVREALRILEAQGVLEVRPGKGAFVIGRPSELSTSEENLRSWFQENAAEVLEMLEVRSALERKAAYLAGSRATPEQIEAMTEILDQADENIRNGDIGQLSTLDQAFHRRLAEASGNSLLAMLVDNTIEALLSPRKSILLSPGRAEMSSVEHRAIAEAIAKRDREGAEQATSEHISSVRKSILALVELPPEDE